MPLMPPQMAMGARRRSVQGRYGIRAVLDNHRTAFEPAIGNHLNVNSFGGLTVTRFTNTSF